MLILKSDASARCVVQASIGALLLEDLGKVRCTLTATDLFSSSLACLNNSFNEADSTEQSRLLPQGKRIAELADQNSDTKLNNAIESVVREIQAGE